MIVTYQEYNDEKQAFFRKHKNDYELETQGGSAEYYRKTYAFKDKAVWYEVMMKQTVSERVEVYKCNVNVELDMLQTEYWSSDDSKSKFYYEPWKV